MASTADTARSAPDRPALHSAARPVPWWRAYPLLLRAAYRAQLQYRADVLLLVVSEIAFQGVGLAFVGVVITTFGELAGWSLAEVAFLYGLRLTASGLCMVVGNQLFQVDGSVRSGEFDLLMIRPVGLLTQLLSRHVYLAPYGNLLTGLTVLSAAIAALPAGLSASGLLYLVLALAGAAMVEGAVWLVLASTSFRTLSSQSLLALTESVLTNFGGYPLSIFPKGAQFALTFVLPLAFIAFLPASVLLDRTDEVQVAAWLAIGAPAVGPVLLALAYGVWRRQLTHYTSSGT